MGDPVSIVIFKGENLRMRHMRVPIFDMTVKSTSFGSRCNWIQMPISLRTSGPLNCLVLQKILK